MNKYIIHEKGRNITGENIVLNIFAAFSCYICIFGFIGLDLLVFQFQHIYFRTHEIPLIERRKYIILDRYKLKKLTFWQKINCLYCEYGNGLMAYAKAVVNQMETYSCSIKHVYQPPGQEHQKDFFERKDFE